MRSAYLLQRSRPSVSTACRYSAFAPCMRRRVDRSREVACATHRSSSCRLARPSRAFTKHQPPAAQEGGRIQRPDRNLRYADAGNPPGLLLPFSACGVGDPHDRGIAVPPRSGHSVRRSRRLTLPETSRAFSARNAHGLTSTFRGFPFRRAGTPLGARSSLAVSPSQNDEPGSRVFIPAEVRSAPPAVKPATQPIPSWPSTL